MRVAAKQIHARNDCFDAVEGECSVRIATHRNTVLVSAQDATGNAVTEELSLPAFSKVIVAAIAKEHSNER